MTQQYHLTLDGIGLILADSGRYQAYQEKTAPTFVPIFGTGERSSSEGDFWSKLRISSWHKGIPQYEMSDQDAYRYGFGLETRTTNRLRLAHVPTTAIATSQDGFKQIVEFNGELYGITPSTNQIWRSNNGSTWSMDLQASFASVVGCLFVKSPPCRVGAATASLPVLYAGSANSRHVYGKPTGGSWAMQYSLPARICGITAMAEGYTDTGAAGAAGPPYLFFGCVATNGAELLIDVNNYDSTITGVPLYHWSHIEDLLYSDTQGAGKVYIAASHRTSNRGAFGIARKFASNYLYDELVRFSDNYIVDLLEHNAQVYAGLKNKGKLWRYTGSNFTPLLELSEPDSQYSYPLQGLFEADGALWVPVQVTGQGIGLLGYDGNGWSIGPYLASSGTPMPGAAYFNGQVYFSEFAAGAAKLYFVDPTKWQVSCQAHTSWFYAGFRDIDKLWKEVTVNMLGLATGESIKIYYSLANSGYLSVQESFDTTAKKDSTTTATWDTDAGQIRLNGLVAQTFVNKVPANLSVPHVAYDRTSVNSLTEAPEAFNSEFSQSQYDNVEADDSANAVSTATLAAADDLTNGKSVTANQSGSGIDPNAIIDNDTATGWGMDAGQTGACYLTIDLGVPTTFNRVNLLHYANGFNFDNLSIQGSNDGVNFTNILTGIDCATGEPTQSTHTFTAVSYRYVRLLDSGRHNLKECEIFGTAAQHYAKQLYAFDLTDLYIAGLKPKVIAYGTGDNGGSAANGCTLKIWNNSTLTWDTVGTNTAAVGDTDAAKTITQTYTSYANYVNSKNKVYLLLHSTYPTRQGVTVSNYVRNATINADFVTLQAYYEASSKNVLTTQLNLATSTNITKATLYTTQATPANTTLTHYLSANGGVNWEAVTVGTEHTFTNPGTDLRWKCALATSDSLNTPTVSDITIPYTQNTWELLGTASDLGLTSQTFSFPNPSLSKEISLRVDLLGNGSSTPALKDLVLTYVTDPTPKSMWDFVAQCKDSLQLLDDSVATMTGIDLYAALKASRNRRQVCTMTDIDGIYYQVKWRDLTKRQVNVAKTGDDRGTEVLAAISLIEA